MDIYLYVNNSEKNKLNKTLTEEEQFTGTLRTKTSVVNPIIHLETENPTAYNYAYIPEFNRYYYITNMSVVRNNLWELSLTVDVLYSFRDYIKNCRVVISDYENGNTNYLMGDVWKNKVKEFTDIISFPSGLSNNGYFILITAGG